MNNKSDTVTLKWFMIVSVLFLVWNLFGMSIGC